MLETRSRRRNIVLRTVSVPHLAVRFLSSITAIVCTASVSFAIEVYPAAWLVMKTPTIAMSLQVSLALGGGQYA